MAAKRDEPIGVAVLALGRSGWNIHVAHLRNDPRFRIVSVLDPDEDRRLQAREELGCEAYTDLGKLLRESPVKLVVVATPSVFHARQAVRVMKTGRHVVVEKPMSSTLRQADRMIRTAGERGVHLFVHQNYRFSVRYQLFKEIVKGGKIGPLTHISYCSHSYRRRNDWQCLRKFSGGQLNNKITHPLDQAISLVDSPVVDILCDLKHVSDAGDVEDHVKMLLRTESGVTIDMEDSSSAATTQNAPEWTFLGAYGAVTLSNGVAQFRYYDKEKAPKIRVHGGPRVKGRLYGNADQLPWEEDQVAFSGNAQHGFYDAVHATLREGREFPIDPRQVREMIRVLEVCRRQNPDFPGR